VGRSGKEEVDSPDRLGIFASQRRWSSDGKLNVERKALEEIPSQSREGRDLPDKIRTGRGRKLRPMKEEMD